MVIALVSRQDGRAGVCPEYYPRNRGERFKKNELKPWKVTSWVIPPARSAEFVANMENVLDVYKEPYDADYPVVCMDESPKQLIEEVRPAIKMKPGLDTKTDYEYIRNGMVNIFIANEPGK